MWRKCCSFATSLFVRRLLVNEVSRSSSPVYYGTLRLSVEVSFIPSPPVRFSRLFCIGVALFSSSVDSENFTGVRRDVDKSESGGGPGIRSVNEESSNGIGGEAISFGEVKRLMRLVNVEALEMKLRTDGKEVIRYS
ncbi:calcium uniporter protein 6 [Cucumis melo var. makuwa]|uniref:Calcium uniporter protein 6 n=1 Tax=Cucumis melo var. makuwa TaxID=1194695 RepID=A0A5A7UR75_CUCMM|nr:calcium uniporter protein 6 [Cucumis melo var. makuwa]TYJ97118.1 calcium uniporter protein 6 [Cucumis melo var. makuwa]